MTFEAQRLPPNNSVPVTPATPMEMLSRALMSGAAPETLEKMLVLQERWEKNEAKRAFDRAIAQAKAEIPTIVKDREVSFGAGKTSYKHEDLVGIAKVVVPILSKYGLSYRWRSEVADKMIVVTCILSHEGGHSEENSLPGPADTSGSKNPIQAIASTVTYLQRYTLKCALGLAAGKDDDAISAGNGGPLPPDKLNDAQVAELTKAIKDSGRDEEWFRGFAKIEELRDLDPGRLEAAVGYVNNLPKVKKAQTLGHMMQQGTEEWLRIRCGRVTASRVRDVVATTKSGGYGAGRKNYMAELVGEKLTGRPAEQFVSQAMADGVRREPLARFAYALATGFEIEEVGFVNHPRIAMAGCSPDGLVGKDGLVEIKCPNLATHIDTLLTEKIDPAYMDQMQFQMACTGRAWCDFVSHDDRLPEEMQMSILRVMRDDKRIEKLEQEVVQFLIDVDATVDLLRKRFLPVAA